MSQYKGGACRVRVLSTNEVVKVKHISPSDTYRKCYWVVTKDGDVLFATRNRRVNPASYDCYFVGNAGVRE